MTPFRAPSGWNEYKVEKLFDSIYKTPSYDDDGLTQRSAQDPDAIPYVTRTESNNGVKSFVSKNGLEAIESGNAIVVGDTTSTVSYQPKPFVAGEHIIAARADWLNEYTGLFVTCLLRRERYRYSYGRAYKLDLIKNTMIRLPADKDGNPDWKWVEDYVRSRPYGDRLEVER